MATSHDDKHWRPKSNSKIKQFSCTLSYIFFQTDHADIDSNFFGTKNERRRKELKALILQIFDEFKILSFRRLFGPGEQRLL